MHAELYMRMCTCTCEGTLVCSKGKLHAQAGRSTVLNRCRFVLFEFGQPQLSSGSLLVDFFEYFGEAWRFYLLEPECEPCLRVRVCSHHTMPCTAQGTKRHTTRASAPCYTPRHSVALHSASGCALHTLRHASMHCAGTHV